MVNINKLLICELLRDPRNEAPLQLICGSAPRVLSTATGSLFGYKQTVYSSLKLVNVHRNRICRLCMCVICGQLCNTTEWIVLFLCVVVLMVNISE